MSGPPSKGSIISTYITDSALFSHPLDAQPEQPDQAERTAPQNERYVNLFREPGDPTREPLPDGPR